VARTKHIGATSTAITPAPTLYPRPASTNTSAPPHTPPESSARLTDTAPGDADATNARPTRTASKGDLRDHAARLMDWCGCHGVRRCCDGQDKASNSDQPDHCFLPVYTGLLRKKPALKRNRRRFSQTLAGEAQPSFAGLCRHTPPWRTNSLAHRRFQDAAVCGARSGCLAADGYRTSGPNGLRFSCNWVEGDPADTGTIR
jgi:hypothetical protein